MYANIQNVCKCARRHAANYSCPSPCFTNVTISSKKKILALMKEAPHLRRSSASSLDLFQQRH